MDYPSDEEIEDKWQEIEDLTPYKESVRKRKIEETDLLINKRLVHELNMLRDSIDAYRYWSKRLAAATVLLSTLLFIVACLQLYLSLR